FKQLIMMSGYDRYFQLAPCFRDEDPRADRSPGEFYQIDMEMAFVEQDQVFEANEYLFTHLFRRFSDWKVTDAPFPRYTYDDIMSRYGSDKPDMRNPLEITDVTKVFADTEFRVFKSVLAQDGNIKAIWVKRSEQPPRKFFDDTVKFFQDISGNGLAWLYFTEDEVKGSISKFISDDEKETLRQQVTKGEQGALFFAGGRESEVLPFIARLRDRLGEALDLLEKDVYKFIWITDYPFYELDPATGKVEFSHNPFGMPQGGLEALNSKDPLTIHATQYDLVCNGLELGSGAIRNHLPEVMYRAFEIVGYSKEEVDEKFGGMIRAFTYGAPPHGGIATGFERIVMLLAKENAIRNVILFPMAQTVEDLMMGAPGTLSLEQLQDVHIRVELPPELKAKQSLANE
ncbi:MAG: aspartate--tRNA ligase, partial [Bdellovibrionales bacterium]|nr:aspartate--tRNA ligase [Bdellovibrionales bacterium]